MDRIQSLIAKLKNQAEQNADVEQMLVTIQLLQNELVCRQKAVKTLNTAKVAVVLPSSFKIDTTIYEKYAPKVAEEAEEVVVQEKVVAEAKKNDSNDLSFDPMDIPTLSHQVVSEDIKPKSKSRVAETESLNDRLKQGKMELLETLREAPVRDLRKAIGINDRFLFINDLFRGDESMYERSLKTINGFNIYAEAEYWINRELKVKLGWDADHPTVIQFDQLVKRRFL
jgi:hypothetical protein